MRFSKLQLKNSDIISLLPYFFQNLAEPWRLTQSTRSPMRVIKVAQPAFLRNPEAWDLNMNHQLRAQLPTDQVRLERPIHAELQAPPETSTLSQNDINSNGL